MQTIKILNRFTLVVLSLCFQIVPVGCINTPVEIKPPLAEQRDNFQGTVDFVTGRTTPFTLQGTEPHIGQYTARGEVTFRDGDTPGSLIGEGVADFETTNGDHLVGVLTWTVGPEQDGNRSSQLEFHWRDSVTFSDGTTAQSTGHFADPDTRPPGLVVIAIIAILIGLLLPAVQ